MPMSLLKVGYISRRMDIFKKCFRAKRIEFEMNCVGKHIYLASVTHWKLRLLCKTLITVNQKNWVCLFTMRLH